MREGMEDDGTQGDLSFFVLLGGYFTTRPLVAK